MKPFTTAQKKCLLALAIFGIIAPNGVIIYFLLVAPEVLHAALSNPVALVFITVAFLLMFLFAWVLRHLGSPVMSLLGSMVFSVPAFLYLASRNARKTSPT